MNFVGIRERDILKENLSTWKASDKQLIWDILIDCDVKAIPNASNINTLVLEAAKTVFVRKPFFLLEKIKIGLGSFWTGICSAEIDSLYESFHVDNETVFNYFDFNTAITPTEERVSSYLQRWLRNATTNLLSLLLEFSTGSAIMSQGEVIKLIYVNRDPRHLKIGSKACFRILYLPRQYDSFSQFKKIVDEILQNPASWAMCDD